MIGTTKSSGGRAGDERGGVAAEARAHHADRVARRSMTAAIRERRSWQVWMKASLVRTRSVEVQLAVVACEGRRSPVEGLDEEVDVEAEVAVEGADAELELVQAAGADAPAVDEDKRGGGRGGRAPRRARGPRRRGRRWRTRGGVGGRDRAVGRGEAVVRGAAVRVAAAGEDAALEHGQRGARAAGRAGGRGRRGCAGRCSGRARRAGRRARRAARGRAPAPSSCGAAGRA